MNWRLELAKSARQQLDRLPSDDRRRIGGALLRMEQDPRGGDVVRLQPVPGLPAFRRRVGGYRILFDLYPERNLILVSDIVRRTTTTYRGRH